MFVRAPSADDVHAVPELMPRSRSGTRGGSLIAIPHTQWKFLGKPLIDITLVDVAPGRVAFAGTYTTGGAPWRSGATEKSEDELSAVDTVREHYLTLMIPDPADKSTFARICGKNPVYPGNYLPSRMDHATCQPSSAA